MPRQARIDIPGSLHHIICRGIERRDIFCDDVDRDNFVSRLVEITTITSTLCFAWALIQNHLHLLLQTGLIPISTLMQKLLSGYATTFNLRHNRHGYLFQNRYKSIMCQEETYLLELVRYIHLNPLRAGIVSSLDSLRDYRYSGHSCILGRNNNLESWMPTKDILEHFGQHQAQSRKAYETFVRDGIAKGPRSDLTGGGLLRSTGGWRELHSAKEAGIFLKSDERILGDSDFVEFALSASKEDFERKSISFEQCRFKGIGSGCCQGPQY
jgi:putative transposase